MPNKNSYPNTGETNDNTEATLQRVELQRGQSVALHEMPEDVRRQVPVLPIQAQKLMGMVQAGKGHFAVFGESSRVENIENALKSSTESPLLSMRMHQDPIVYYVDAEAQRYVSAGRMSQGQNGRLVVGRTTIVHDAERHGMTVGPDMSREHFTLVQAHDGSLSIEDHSTNGTSVLTGMEIGAEQDGYGAVSRTLGHTAVLPELQ